MTIRPTAKKIVDIESAAALRERVRSEGKKVVFTNGCFDIVHRGHVEYLEAARSFGDVLIVGLNTDASVRRLKPGGRPVVPENDRAHVVAALEFVDAVCFFEEDTPAKLIDRLQPDVLVKGAEYRPEEIVGYDTVVRSGGEVKTVEMIPGRSTTGIIERIKQLPG